MALSFQRQQAGEYNVLDNGKAIAYIQKANSSKWITYFCSNPAIKGKPQNVAKTLKESKAFCENHFGSTYIAPAKVSENSPQLDDLIKDVRGMNTDKYDLMKEMMENDYVIDLNEYKQTEDGLEPVELTQTRFLTEEEIMAL